MRDSLQLLPNTMNFPSNSIDLNLCQTNQCFYREIGYTVEKTSKDCNRLVESSKVGEKICSNNKTIIARMPTNQHINTQKAQIPKPQFSKARDILITLSNTNIPTSNLPHTPEASETQ